MLIIYVVLNITNAALCGLNFNEFNLRYECSFNGTSWPHQSPNAPFKYMLISKTKEHGSLVDEPFAERMKFWDRLRLPWKFPLR